MAYLSKSAFTNAEELKTFRYQHRMNQTEFWSPIGVTQSAGSRYESGRNIPVPTQTLLLLIYGAPRRAEQELEKLRRWNAAKEKSSD